MDRLTKCNRWHDDIDLKEEMGYAYIYDRLLFPAHAGVILYFSAWINAIKSFPRMCGGMSGGAVSCYMMR